MVVIVFLNCQEEKHQRSASSEGRDSQIFQRGHQGGLLLGLLLHTFLGGVVGWISFQLSSWGRAFFLLQVLTQLPLHQPRIHHMYSQLLDVFSSEVRQASGLHKNQLVGTLIGPLLGMEERKTTMESVISPE